VTAFARAVSLPTRYQRVAAFCPSCFLLIVLVTLFPLNSGQPAVGLLSTLRQRVGLILLIFVMVLSLVSFHLLSRRIAKYTVAFFLPVGSGLLQVGFFLLLARVFKPSFVALASGFFFPLMPFVIRDVLLMLLVFRPPHWIGPFWGIWAAIVGTAMRARGMLLR
jgi:hypothetical protein